MPYTLDAFRADLRTSIQSRGVDALPDLARKLGDLLRNPDFVAATFDETTPLGSKRELAHDPETGAYVLAHVHAPSRGGAPHSHGDSWAIYGTARGETIMTEYARIDDGNPEGTALTVADRYPLGPGDTKAYSGGAIHSTANEQTTWVIRITGADLDTVPRYRFNRTTDRLIEKTPAG